MEESLLDLDSCTTIQKLCPALQLLDFTVSFKTWNSVHFLGHFFMVAIIAVSMVNPPRKPCKKEAAHGDKPAEKSGQAVPPIQTGGSR